MKHLISLSFKYISRQKLRSLLTFLCVTLSVFIFCSFGAYSGALYKMLMNTQIKEDGFAEADIYGWTNASPKGLEAADIVKNHAAVSDYFISVGENEQGYFDRPYGKKGIRYISVSDGKNSRRFQNINCQHLEGNPELLAEEEKKYFIFDEKIEDGSYIVPNFFKDWGYKVGDELTFTLRMVNAEFDENSEMIQQLRREVYAETGYSMVRDDPGILALTKEERKNVTNSNMISELKFRFDISYDEVPLTNEKFGDEYEYTVKIGGFRKFPFDEIFNLWGINDLTPIMSDFITANFEANVADEAVEYEDTEKFKPYTVSADIRTNPKMDHDDAMQEIYESLGYSGEYYLSDENFSENSFLLALELRASAALGEFAFVVLVLAFFTVLVWFMARFVIDNAFEISAKERSSQYAALRIMGASKGQIRTVVLTEAIFYILTAVPIGATAAFVLCSVNVSAIRNSGFDEFEYFMPWQLALAVIFLSVLAIFISAFTSAMWASRKLSPAEALNFGKPSKRKKKQKHHKKSKLRLSSRKFIKRYTWKNIMRTKSRFIIASITMALGVTLFLFSVMVGINLLFEFKSYENNMVVGDFECVIWDCEREDIENVKETFGNSDTFSSYTMEIHTFRQLEKTRAKKYSELLSEITPEEYKVIDTSCYLFAIDRNSYNKYVADTIDVTYDELVDSNGVLYCASVYGSMNQYEWNEDGTRKEIFSGEGHMLDEPMLFNILEKQSPLKVVGTCFSKQFEGFVFPIDSANFRIVEGDFITVDLTVDGKDNYETAKKEVEAFSATVGNMDYWDNYTFCTGLKEMITAIMKMVLVFVFAIWLVGILSMVNSINTSVLNRSRELMMLRSVGMTKKQLKNLIVRESITFSSVSSIVGTALAVLSYAVIVRDLTGGKWAVAIICGGVILSIIINIAISILASKPGIRSLERAESIAKAL